MFADQYSPANRTSRPSGMSSRALDDTGTELRGVEVGGGASSSGTMTSPLLSRSPFSRADAHTATAGEHDRSGAPTSVTSACAKLCRGSSPADEVCTVL